MSLLKRALDLKSRGGFSFVLSLLLAFSVAFVPFLYHASSAYAAAITTASDTLTREKISEDSDHTIEFDTPTGVDDATDTITVTFADDFDLSSVLISDVDFEVEGTDKFIAPTAATGVWGYSRSGQVMTFTAPSDAAVEEISVGDTITVKVGTGAGDAGWNLSTVDSGGTVGTFTSIDAVDFSTIFISYFDDTNKDLKVAKSTDGGSSWTDSTVDSAGIVGKYTSISAVDASTVFISYYDESSTALKVAKTTNGGTSWTPATVDSTGLVGTYTSIAAVSATVVYISYYDDTNDDLKVAKTTNGTDWTPATVDSADAVGSYTSIDAVDALTVFISYYDTTNTALKVAKTTNGTDWTPATVDSGGTSVGRYTSISAVDSSTVYISYRDNTNTDLKAAKTTNGTDWTTSTVDSTGYVDNYTSISAVDSSTAFISYYEDIDSELRFAKTTNGTDWTTSTLAASGSVGLYPSIDAVNSSTVYISYYDDSGGADLNIARTYDADGGSNQIGNPGTVGAYGIDIGGVFGDSGSIFVPIVDDDRVTVTASIETYIHFDIDIDDKGGTTGASAHDTDDDATYDIELGDLLFTSVTTEDSYASLIGESNDGDPDNDGVEEIYFDLTTNATGGAVIDIYAASDTLASASSGDSIPSFNGTLTTSTEDGGWGLACQEHYDAVETGSLDTHTDFAAPFNGGPTAVEPVPDGVWDNVFDTNGAAIQFGDGVCYVRAVSGTSTHAADDYTRTLYFRATATF